VVQIAGQLGKKASLDRHQPLLGALAGHENLAHPHVDVGQTQ
jgi:hypothetical protein